MLTINSEAQLQPSHKILTRDHDFVICVAFDLFFFFFLVILFSILFELLKYYHQSTLQFSDCDHDLENKLTD